MKFPKLKPDSDAMLHFDLLRFIAALAIVFHHSHGFFYNAADRKILNDQTHGLGLFVDLFFLISGYVISYTYYQRVNNFSKACKFFQRRIGRLVPLHWAMLAISTIIVAIASLFGPMATPPDLSTSCIIKTTLLLQAIYPCSGSPPNPVSWSISTEMLLYTLFPMFIAIANKYKNIFLSISILSAIYTIVYAYNLSPHDWTDSYAPLRALPSFMFGMSLFIIRDKLPTFFAVSKLMWISLILLMFSMIIGLSSGILLIIIYIIGLSGVMADKIKSPQLVHKLSGLGQLTYSIYMIHYIVIIVLINAISDKILKLNGFYMFISIFLSYGIILILSYISYFYFENPLRRWVDGLNLSYFDSRLKR